MDAADIATFKPGPWHEALEPFMTTLFGRASPPAKGFSYVWNKRAPGTVGIVDMERNTAMVFQLLASGKLCLLPHQILVDDPGVLDLIASEIRRRNPPTEVHAN
jgi:hypothetical protein